MKRNLVIVLGVISLIADIITMTSALKWVLINWLGVEEKNATSINTIIIVIATACLLLTLLYACWYTYEKFKKAGTREIACALIPYLRYKVRNKNNTLLRSLHCDLYHIVIDIKRHIRRIRQQRGQNQQNAPISLNEVENQMQTLLRSFHSVLYDTFHLDLSINVYLTGMEGENTVLTRSLFLKSRREQNRGEQRQMDYKYIIHNCNSQELKDYTLNAHNYHNLHPNDTYQKNSVFDYVLSTNNCSWISNDLRIDEKNGLFFSSSRYYKRKYKSLAVFAIIPPSNGQRNAIKGVLTFDTFNTRLFSEEECTMLMGLLAHHLYEILNKMN